MKLSLSLSGTTLLVITLLASLPPTFAATAHVPQTGQTASFAAGDDGDIQAGADWPTPRFRDNKDGTVRDNLTGLTWLKDANCFGALTWANALNAANQLADDPTSTTMDCGLSDHSVVGDWRLPNIREIHSLIDFGFFSPSLSNAAGTAQWTNNDAFTNVQVGGYWSSTTAGSDPSVAFTVFFGSGNIFVNVKRDPGLVWLVRGRE
jgi:hypothetical protein